MLEIGVVTINHPGRDTDMLARAARSVAAQQLPARAHIIVTDVNRRGASFTRQEALQLNPYPWTAFLDSDDWFMPQHLRRLAEEQVATGADYVYSWFKLVLHNKALTYDPVFPTTHFTEPWDPANPRQTTITVLVRTELALEVGFIEPEPDGTFADGHKKGEDWYFTLGCNERGKIHHFAERTWYWHHHGKNTSGTPGEGDAA